MKQTSHERNYLFSKKKKEIIHFFYPKKKKKFTLATKNYLAEIAKNTIKCWRLFEFNIINSHLLSKVVPPLGH